MLSNKIFFGVCSFWYITFFSGVYFSLATFGGATWGRYLTLIDSIIMLSVFTLFLVVFMRAIKKHDYFTATITTLLVLWPIYWMYLTIYDTFFLLS